MCVQALLSTNRNQIGQTNVPPHLHEQDWHPQQQRRQPGEEHSLLGLAHGAEVLGLQRVHDGVVPGMAKKSYLVLMNTFSEACEIR